MAGLALQRGQGVSADPPLGLRRFKDACRAGYGPGCTAGGLLGIELAAAQGDAGRTAAADAVGMLQRGCELEEKVACTVLEQAAGGSGPAAKDWSALRVGRWVRLAIPMGPRRFRVESQQESP